MKLHLFRPLILSALLLGALLGMPVHPAHAIVGATLYVSPTGSDTGNCQNSASPCATIAYALTKASAGNNLSLSGGTYHEHGLAINFDLSVYGTGMGQTIIDGDAAGQVLSIGASSTVFLQSLTIRNGLTTGSGGGILNSGTLNMSQVRVTGNHADSGGGIISYTQLQMLDSQVDNNISDANGGGLFLTQPGLASLSHVAIYGNQSLGGANYGGGIHQQGGGSLYLTSVSLYNNTAHIGGALVNTGGSTLHILNSSISANHASWTGGLQNYSTADLKNTLLSGNDVADCDNGGTLTDNGYNLLSDASCSTALTNVHDLHSTPVTVNLVSPAWTGYVPVLAPVAGSPTIDAGTNTGCASDDARGVIRPVDGDLNGSAVCDIGAYEFRPGSAISVISVSPDPSLVGVPVTVNVAVTGAGPVPTGYVSIQLPEDTCTATISVTGTGSCTLTPTVSGLREIDVYHEGDAQYEGSSNFASHIVTQATMLVSNSAQDGWVLETSENSKVGGTLAATGSFRVGDNASRKQYRSILSFPTGGLPDTAVITALTLQIKRQNAVGGSNLLTTFHGFMLDVKNGTLGTAALQPGDFQAPASHTYGPFAPALASGWYNIDLTGAKDDINKLPASAGLTQIRLRFKLDDNNNAVANYFNLFSGNAAAANRPQLIITYYVP